MALPRALSGERALTFVLVAALVVVAALVHRLALGRPVFPVDDAYITLHNARALLNGHDPNFPGVSPLTGATSLLHLAIAALFSVLHGALNGLYLSMWLGVLVYATGLVRLAFAFGANRRQALLLLVLGLGMARVPYQLLNGLETGLSMGAVAWALALAAETGRERWLGVVCGLMPFLRPELALLSVALLALKGWLLLRAGRRRRAAAMVGCALAAAAPFVLWSLIEVGSLLPSTAGAKIAWFAEAHLPASTKWHWLRHELWLFVTTIGIATAGAIALFFFGIGRAMLLFAAAFVAFYYVEFPGGLNHYAGRYLYVLLPGVVLGLAWAIGRSRVLRIVALVVVAASLVQAAFVAPGRWDFYTSSQDWTRQNLASVAAWSDTHLPRGSKLLVHDVGFISYATSFHLVDLVGLKTPGVVKFHKRLTLPSAGARRGDAINEIALQQRPQYLVVLDVWDGLFQITGALRAHGWTVQPLRIGVYSVYRLSPPP